MSRRFRHRGRPPFEGGCGAPETEAGCVTTPGMMLGRNQLRKEDAAVVTPLSTESEEGDEGEEGDEDEEGDEVEKVRKVRNARKVRKARG